MTSLCLGVDYNDLVLFRAVDYNDLVLFRAVDYNDFIVFRGLIIMTSLCLGVDYNDLVLFEGFDYNDCPLCLGGSVISTRCSETYHRRTAQLSLFGIPLWYTSNSPRTIIQPDVQPGQCWAFRGTHGYLVIQLAATIKPTSVSVEHIPKFLSPTGKIDSAPKDFSVWASLPQI